MNHLLIVESPAKVKTIKKFLGSNYKVVASQGHVRDMPKSQLGVGPENDYEPKYITIRGKGPILAELRKEVKKADKIYLATDPDREGEAISWHLTQGINMEGKEVYRVTFNEITKSAVKAALKNVREIDQNLVDAQQARRILDRIVGYKISPVLWAKVKNGLSAGRVQSAALHMIAVREQEINGFIPEEYWSMEALFSNGKDRFTAKLTGKNGTKIQICSGEDAEKTEKELQSSVYKISEVRTGERKRSAPLPFITSTLQQEAANVLNFSAQKTMRIAQQLYEGVEIKGEGTIGIITYLRTDSVRVSEEASEMAEQYIGMVYGKEYLRREGIRKNHNTKIQDAHEAIRPTDIHRKPEDMKGILSRDQQRLYQLIWNRFVASFMASAVYETKMVCITDGAYEFSLNGSRQSFAGFQKVYGEKDEGEKMEIPEGLEKDMELFLRKVEKKQHFTQPKPHYSEAGLIRELEELGIGRPSTYAPIITTLLSRHYITKENKNLYITEIGSIVDEMMKQAFPAIVDTQFTANVESLLDSVAEGKTNWKTIIRNFYPDMEEAVANAEKSLERVEIKEEETEILCEKCGRNMVVKLGPYGKFLACPGFPECRNTQPFLEKTGTHCPECGGEIAIKTSKKGRKFFGCSNFPECGFVSWNLPVDWKCSKCGSYMVEKGKYILCANKECQHREELP